MGRSNVRTLLSGFLVKIETDRNSRIRINGAVIEIDVLNFSLLIDHEGGATRPLVLISPHWIFPQDSVLGQNLAVHIAEQREGDANLLGKRGIRRGTINTNSENGRVAGFELGQISLNGLKFFRSTTCERENVEGKHHVLFAPIIG